MLSQAELQTHINDITLLGESVDQQINDSVNDQTTKSDAINQTKSLMPKYQQEVRNIMNQAIYNIAANSLHHYQTQTTKVLPQDIVDKVVRDQYRQRYYGATLGQRLMLLKLRLNRVVTQTAQTGVDNLSGLFSKPFPFGAQTNVTKRLLQGTAIKVEQDIARKVAESADIPLIRWTLSKDHIETCECEALAEQVNKNIVSYLTINKLEDVDPKGLFFREHLPDPPHPNCRCDFNLVGEEEIEPQRGYRPIGKLRKLIRKLLSFRR